MEKSADGNSLHVDVNGEAVLKQDHTRCECQAGRIEQ